MKSKKISKKILSSILAGAMVLSTMSFTAFAADDTDIIEVGADKTYTTWSDAVRAAADNDHDGAITYQVYGKVDVDETDWVSPRGNSGATTINFVGMTDDAEICIPTATPTIIATNGITDMAAINYTNLKLSRPNGAYTGDMGHANNYFTTWIRGAGNAVVNYTKCVFPNGSSNNQYAKTVYKNCTFNNTSAYALWVYGGEVEVSGSTFKAKKGVKVYSETPSAQVTTSVKNSTFDIESKPAVVSSIGGTLTLDNVNADACEYGLLATKYWDPNDTTSSSLADVTVDGQSPAYVASVNGSLYTSQKYADEEAAENNVDAKIVVAKINNDYYSSLADAVAAVKDGETVTLLADAEGTGIIVPSGSNFTIDFGGHTYTVSKKPLAGSPGYESQAFQLLKNSTLTFKNGTIKFDDSVANDAAMIIQNYANLTLENMVLDGSNIGKNMVYAYTLSNNSGNVNITGSTSIKASTKNAISYAFDVCKNRNYDAPTVTVNTTGTIDGQVEVTTPTTDNLVIQNGTFTVATAHVNGTATPLSTFVDANNAGDVNIKAETISVRFDKVAAAELENSEYDIVLVGADATTINRLTSADLTFEFTSDKDMSYEIEKVENINIITDTATADRYAFHFDGINAPDETATEITIGRLKVTGYGQYDFNVKDVTTNIVNATTLEDSIVNSYYVGGAAAGKGELDINNKLENVEIKVPTKKLTVNVTFNNEITDNAKAYQDMQAVISGGDLTEDITVDFGTDAEKLENNVYSFTKELTENTAYTVTVEGAGYRTARYTVTMTEDKTLNFWNNVKDEINAMPIEVGKTNKVSTNFLAGDIVKDNNINLYDLSAVVSYFGSTSDTNNGYAKYDLNRDGVIDSKDVAYVLVSWGN